MLKYISIIAVAFSLGACAQGITISPGNGGVGKVTVKPAAPNIKEQFGDGEKGQIQTTVPEAPVTP